MSPRENFPVGSLLIRRDLRRAVHAYYRFARAADDCADDPGLDVRDKLATLARFEAGLGGDPDGAPEARALKAAVEAAGAPATTRHAAALLTAFRQDAAGVVCRSWEDLLAYCRNSADPVGRFLLELHHEGPAGVAASDRLCTALQVLNHLQDLRADFTDLGRIYLPLDWLEAAGGRRADLAAARTGPALRRAIDDALLRCDAMLDEAAELPGALASRRLAGEALGVLALARRLSGRLRRGDPLAARVAPSRLDFMRAGLAGALEAARPRARPRASVAGRERA